MQEIGELPGSWRVRHDKIPPDLAKTLYTKVQELALRDSSPVGVARRISALYFLSLSPGTVRHWMVGDRKLQRRNTFKQEPSPALSYIIGANIGDGCTLTKGQCVKLEVTDLHFAQKFNENMATLFSHLRPNKILVKRYVDRTLPMYVVKYSSKQLLEILRQPLKKLVEIAAVFPREFLRGFFDAEGHVDVGIGKEFHLTVGAENSDKPLLLLAKQMLESLAIESRIVRKRTAGSVKVIRGEGFVMRRTSFSLVIGRIEDARRYACEVGFSIPRKARKLEDAILIIDTVAAKDRPHEWMQLYMKERGEWTRRTPR